MGFDLDLRYPMFLPFCMAVVGFLPLNFDVELGIMYLANVKTQILMLKA